MGFRDDDESDPNKFKCLQEAIPSIEDDEHVESTSSDDDETGAPVLLFSSHNWADSNRNQDKSLGALIPAQASNVSHTATDVDEDDSSSDISIDSFSDWEKEKVSAKGKNALTSLGRQTSSTQNPPSSTESHDPWAALEASTSAHRPPLTSLPSVSSLEEENDEYDNDEDGDNETGNGTRNDVVVGGKARGGINSKGSLSCTSMAPKSSAPEPPPSQKRSIVILSSSSDSDDDVSFEKLRNGVDKTKSSIITQWDTSASPLSSKPLSSIGESSLTKTSSFSTPAEKSQFERPLETSESEHTDSEDSAASSDGDIEEWYRDRHRSKAAAATLLQSGAGSRTGSNHYLPEDQAKTTSNPLSAPLGRLGASSASSSALVGSTASSSAFSTTTSAVARPEPGTSTSSRTSSRVVNLISQIAQVSAAAAAAVGAGSQSDLHAPSSSSLPIVKPNGSSSQSSSSVQPPPHRDLPPPPPSLLYRPPPPKKKTTAAVVGEPSSSATLAGPQGEFSAQPFQRRAVTSSSSPRPFSSSSSPSSQSDDQYVSDSSSASPDSDSSFRRYVARGSATIPEKSKNGSGLSVDAGSGTAPSEATLGVGWFVGAAGRLVSGSPSMQRQRAGGGGLRVGLNSVNVTIVDGSNAGDDWEVDGNDDSFEESGKKSAGVGGSKATARMDETEDGRRLTRRFFDVINGHRRSTCEDDSTVWSRDGHSDGEDEGEDLKTEDEEAVDPASDSGSDFESPRKLFRRSTSGLDNDLYGDLDRKDGEPSSSPPRHPSGGCVVKDAQEPDCPRGKTGRRFGSSKKGKKQAVESFSSNSGGGALVRSSGASTGSYHLKALAELDLLDLDDLIARARSGSLALSPAWKARNASAVSSRSQTQTMRRSSGRGKSFKREKTNHGSDSEAFTSMGLSNFKSSALTSRLQERLEKPIGLTPGAVAMDSGANDMYGSGSVADLGESDFERYPVLPPADSLWTDSDESESASVSNDASDDSIATSEGRGDDGEGGNDGGENEGEEGKKEKKEQKEEEQRKEKKGEELEKEEVLVESDIDLIYNKNSNEDEVKQLRDDDEKEKGGENQIDVEEEKLQEEPLMASPSNGVLASDVDPLNLSNPVEHPAGSAPPHLPIILPPRFAKFGFLKGPFPPGCFPPSVPMDPSTIPALSGVSPSSTVKVLDLRSETRATPKTETANAVSRNKAEGPTDVLELQESKTAFPPSAEAPRFGPGQATGRVGEEEKKPHVEPLVKGERKQLLSEPPTARPDEKVTTVSSNSDNCTTDFIFSLLGSSGSGSGFQCPAEDKHESSLESSISAFLQSAEALGSGISATLGPETTGRRSEAAESKGRSETTAVSVETVSTNQCSANPLEPTVVQKSKRRVVLSDSVVCAYYQSNPASSSDGVDERFSSSTAAAAANANNTSLISEDCGGDKRIQDPIAPNVAATTRRSSTTSCTRDLPSGSSASFSGSVGPGDLAILGDARGLGQEVPLGPGEYYYVPAKYRTPSSSFPSPSSSSSSCCAKEVPPSAFPFSSSSTLPSCTTRHTASGAMSGLNVDSSASQAAVETSGLGFATPVNSRNSQCATTCDDADPEDASVESVVSKKATFCQTVTTPEAAAGTTAVASTTTAETRESLSSADELDGGTGVGTGQDGMIGLVTGSHRNTFVGPCFPEDADFFPLVAKFGQMKRANGTSGPARVHDGTVDASEAKSALEGSVAKGSDGKAAACERCESENVEGISKRRDNEGEEEEEEEKMTPLEYINRRMRLLRNLGTFSGPDNYSYNGGHGVSGSPGTAGNRVTVSHGSNDQPTEDASEGGARHAPGNRTTETSFFSTGRDEGEATWRREEAPFPSRLWGFVSASSSTVAPNTTRAFPPCPILDAFLEERRQDAEAAAAAAALAALSPPPAVRMTSRQSAAAAAESASSSPKSIANSHSITDLDSDDEEEWREEAAESEEGGDDTGDKTPGLSQDGDVAERGTTTTTTREERGCDDSDSTSPPDSSALSSHVMFEPGCVLIPAGTIIRL